MTIRKVKIFRDILERKLTRLKICTKYRLTMAQFDELFAEANQYTLRFIQGQNNG